jgi:hypothetical protein
MRERIAPHISSILAVSVVLAVVGRGVAQPPNPLDDWKFDIIHLKNGKIYKGLILNETAATIRIQYLQPGRTHTAIQVTSYSRSEVKRIERLGDREREELAKRFYAIDPATEPERVAKLELTPGPWGTKSTGGLSFTAKHFALISNAQADLVRLAAFRIQQISDAYTRWLPPRCPRGKSTTIRLVRSPEEYQKILRSEGHNFLNPAFYDAERNQITCASNWEQLETEFARVREKHQQELERIKKQLRHNDLPPRVREQLMADENAIKNADTQNELKLERAKQRLFQILYHEAFHAYLANSVYPPKEAEVPHWLNEGLAQIFETATLDLGELRIERPHLERLNRVQAALKPGGKFVALRELLQAGAQQFLVDHTSDQQVSDRYYLASWALAFYLTFDRKKLGTPELDRYVRALKGGADPLAAFGDLVGQPLDDFETAFHHYLRCLRGDGSTGLSTEKPPH